MRVKEVERTVNVAWSPADQHPILLAGGTAAQQLDATFSTTAALELFSLNLSEPGTEMERVGGAQTEQRFHKLNWSRDLLIGGCDSGTIQIYNIQSLMKGQDAPTAKREGHNGAVKALDVNPFQQNLLASGASDSEIYIWDLDQLGSPMTPGAKIAPPDSVSWLSWNRQVQHILASTFASRCVVWDLRKNEPIIKLADSTSHARWNVVNWHPDVATQLCLASEDDMAPVVQLWDLRFATSPLKTLAGHTRAVTCIAWCAKDPDLLLSCGRDNRILCWNPNEPNPGQELLCEIQTPHQWLFDVAWCPRNPSLISCSSFDGHVSIYSLTGGQQSAAPTSNKIADSFPGMESIAPAMVSQPAVQTHVDLRKAPKWLRKPAGSSFAFGGRLVQFSSAEPGKIVINQMVSEPELLNNVTKLESALAQGQYAEFCAEQSQTASSTELRTLWNYLGAQFEAHPQSSTLTLLGYPLEQLNNSLNAVVGEELDQLANDVSQLSTNGDLLNGSQNSFSSFYDKAAEEKIEPFSIPNSQDPEGKIGQALLVGRVDAAVEMCLKENRMADALLLAMTGGPELLAKTQQRYFKQSKGWLSHLISAVVSQNWSTIISTCSLSSWAQLLAGVITHTHGDDFFILCQQLGERLESDPEYKTYAQVCYLCSGNLEKLVTSWDSAPSSNLHLQELVQVAVLLQVAASRSLGRTIPTTGALSDLLSKYAFLLASQGSLSSALTCLESAQDESALELKDRLQTGLGMKGQPRAVQQQQQQQQQHSFRRTSGHQIPAAQSYDQPMGWSRSRTVSQSSGYEPSVPTMAPYQPPGSIYQPQAPSSAYPSAPSPAPMQFQQPLQPAAPAPPPTGGKPAGLSSGPGRKYVADPSLQGNSPYGQSYGGSQYGQSSPYGSSASPYSASPYGGGQPAAQQPNLYSPNNFSSPQQPNIYTPAAPVQSGMTPNVFNPAAAPMSNSTPYTQMSEPPQSAALPPRPQPRLMESQMAPPGWNDPPPVSRALQPKTELDAPAPITHPLFGVAPEPAPVNTGINGGYYQPAQPPMAANQQYMYPAASQAPVEKAVIAEPPKPKAEIPAEHADIARVLNALKDQCVNVAGNPQMRRKLEDVGRKLETLYDSLREHKLSQGSLASLHQLIQFIQAGDYQSSLNLHTQMISGQDFSQMSAFMPSIKVLLQTSYQFSVYVQ